MSGNGDDEKPEPGKTFPLDLAAKITTVKAMDGKTPVVMTGQPLRNMRVLTQPGSLNPGHTSVVTPTIITTNIVPQAVIKQTHFLGEANRSQVTGIINASQSQSQGTGSITLQRPTQITLATTLPVVAATMPVSQSSYHIPRGPAVVANLPRSNVAAAIRTPMVVTAQTNQPQAFVRPPRTPSPAQGTAWLTTNSSNGSQIKGAPTVLSSPVRGASVTGALGKPQLLTKTQPTAQTVSTIRPTTATILHQAITIGQGTQIHPFKPGQGAASIQALGNTVTLTQVLPSRTQTLVYSTGGNGAQFATTPRLAVANTVPSQRQVPTPKPVAQVATARLTMPISVTQAGTARLVAPQGTVLTTGTRISAVSAPQQPTMIGATPTRIVSTTQSNVTVGRLAVNVSASPAQASNANMLGQTRISNLTLHPLMAVAGNNQQRTLQAQGAKVITQPVQGNTIHLPQMPTVMKSNPNVTTAPRTINVQPANLMTQRPVTTGSSQTVSISKVFSQQVDNSQAQGTQPTANIFIHAPIASVPRKPSPGPGPPVVTQTTTTVPTTAVSTYSLASGTYFYDASGTYSVARPFNPQSSFAAVPQSTNQQIRPASLTTQVHGIVSNQQMRFNPVMVVEQNRVSQFSQQQPEPSQESPQHLSAPINKITSSPRPSILRKRDHEGTPLKAAKNLAPQLGILPLQTQPPISPPSRPDSGENCHSSGGSTTISATSSPGLAEVNEDSMPHLPVNIKEEEENARPPPEMSPRKKPRKQQLTGNDLDENLHDDMQFISETNIKKAPESDGNRSETARDDHLDSRRVLRKPTASLLNSYRQTWKATHNHYLRYADVRPKDERRPTIMDLSNQYRVLDKVNGWKIHHLSTQMEDLADQEQNVYNQLTELLKDTEAQEGNGFDKDVNRINELIKGNMQRIKIINDGMIEAKTQIMKIFDHKIHVTDIISRCASKRNFKKREKS